MFSIFHIQLSISSEFPVHSNHIQLSSTSVLPVHFSNIPLQSSCTQHIGIFLDLSPSSDKVVVWTPVNPISVSIPAAPYCQCLCALYRCPVSLCLPAPVHLLCTPARILSSSSCIPPAILQIILPLSKFIIPVLLDICTLLSSHNSNNLCYCIPISLQPHLKVQHSCVFINSCLLFLFVSC